MNQNDPRFEEAIKCFNNSDWYDAHDLFEEIWHESIDPERRSIQAILQVAVAQLHLQRGNIRGATILFGEALGRLKRPGAPKLGLDMTSFCICVEERLCLLQSGQDPEISPVPHLIFSSLIDK